jgi:hypothetical protein
MTDALLVLVVSVAQAADSPYQTAVEVDRLLQSRVLDSTAKPNALADDPTFLRRAFLDLVGELPTSDDVLAFSLDEATDKRRKLINSLLADEAFGKNWARYWRDVILYRRTEDRVVVYSRRVLVDYLANEFNSNQSWQRDQESSLFVLRIERNVRGANNDDAPF